MSLADDIRATGEATLAHIRSLSARLLASVQRRQASEAMLVAVLEAASRPPAARAAEVREMATAYLDELGVHVRRPPGETLPSRRRR